MERFILSTARKLAYAFATVIILIACLVGAAQLLTPYLDKHLPDIERMASSYLKKPVSIASARISWDQYQPVLSLRKITIRDEKTNKPIIQIQKISIFFSLINSIKHWEVSPGGILIAGTALRVYQNTAGEISVQGFPRFGGDQPFQEETKIRDIMSWLFQHDRLILRDIDVSYTDRVNLKRELTLYNLSMQNSGNKHVLVGKAVLHQDIPTEATIAVSMEGTAQAYEQIKGNIYLYVSGFSLSQWLKGKVWQGWQVNNGIGSAKIWASWEQGAIQHVQSIFQLYDVKLYSLVNKSIHAINRLSAHLGWKREGVNQTFAADDVLINLPNHLWPITSFSVTTNQATDDSIHLKSLNLGYVDISDVESFLFSSAITLPDSVKKILSGTQFDGELHHVSVIFKGENSDWQHTTGKVAFNHLSTKPWQQYPGIKNLSGVANWDGKKGVLSFNTQGLEFRHDKVFANTLKIDRVTGDVEISHDNENNVWQLFMPNLQLLNADLAANVSGKLFIPASGEVDSDINASFSMMDANHVTQYLPAKFFSPELNKWLQTAFLQGKVSNATAQMRGKLKDFPFDEGNGIFHISGLVSNVDLLFAPDWPQIKKINGKVTFTGNQVVVDVDQGWLMNIPFKNVHAEIPYLGDAKPNILYIKTENIPVDAATGMAFIHASPLEASIGKMFKDMALEGPLSLNLNLTVPLADPDKIQIQGMLNANKINLNLMPWNLHVNNVKGQIHFTENSTDSAPLTGTFFNKPITIQLATLVNKVSGKSTTQAIVRNHMDLTDIVDWLKIPLGEVATGGAEVRTILDLAFDTPLRIKLQSNLEGITLNLPDQYAKKANEKRDFTADITVQENKPLQVKLAYNNALSAALILDKLNNDFHLTGANLRLGGGEPEWPKGAGIYITGVIDALNWDKIKSYIAQSQNDQSTLKGYTLQNINVLINKLDVFGQQLSAVQVEVTPTAKSYEIKINSSQAKGNIGVPVVFSNAETINAQFDWLTLQGGGAGKQSLDIDFKTLPAISFAARELNYNDMRLGQVTVKTRPHRNGQSIDILQIISRNANLRASGDWEAAGKGYRTTLKGNINADHVSGFLNELGVNAHNFVAGKGRANFNLSWHDAFFSPDVATLSGDFSLNLGAGRIVDVGDTNSAKMDLGKMLSLFSLQSIPRRLSLDFSDIFQKGYSFDFLRGNYTLANGNVFTNNMRIEGPVAKITIDGRIGLKNKDVDFVLNVTPYVTSSLPVAAGLLTANPLIGLGAFAVNSVISSRVVTYSYNVVGPWSDPSWQEVGGANKR